MQTKPGKHCLTGDPAATPPSPKRDPGLMAAPRATPEAIPFPKHGPGRDTKPHPDPVPGVAWTADNSQHLDLNPPSRLWHGKTLIWADLVHSKPGPNSGTTLAACNEPPTEHAREVIRLCEENDNLKNMIKRLVNEMPEGCRAVSGQPGGQGVCALIDKKPTHLTHDLKLADSITEYVMVEILLDTL
ncbi:hypothetical protein HPB50_026971 [Hyalomma asiaticum]|uniref:Uncharacterized protein n=1 Tax=Hyalomma asiaticum TaxID=266040 RepID=A0ACB7SZG2_HYAAI|nr:hypothetical protein HPB50_026971 [Hyalomma asiaticum]